MPEGIYFIYSPCAGRSEAEAIGERLVVERLAACANIIPAITSIYRWRGKLVKEKEAVLIAKTHRPLVDKAIARIGELHSYELPSITAFCEAAAEAKWRAWLAEQLK